METLLDVINLNKSFKKFRLKDVNLQVPKGSIVGFVGENGAGKSTTINCILREIKKDSGTIRILGKESFDMDIKERVGVVFDEENFYDTLELNQIDTIMKNIYKQWDSSVFQNYTQKFDLPDHKKISEYSRGMKMKLSISIALSHHSELLVLDEPTSGLDPVMREDMLDVFLDFVQDENHAILISSHISTDLEKIADYIAYIRDGKVLFQTSKDELLYQYGILRCTSKEYAMLDKEDIVLYRKQEMGWEVLVRNKEKMEKKYKGMVIDAASIDEIMMIYAKGEAA